MVFVFFADDSSEDVMLFRCNVAVVDEVGYGSFQSAQLDVVDFMDEDEDEDLEEEEEDELEGVERSELDGVFVVRSFPKPNQAEVDVVEGGDVMVVVVVTGEVVVVFSNVVFIPGRTESK